jgi:hypothetical protein
MALGFGGAILGIIIYLIVYLFAQGGTVYAVAKKRDFVVGGLGFENVGDAIQFSTDTADFAASRWEQSLEGLKPLGKPSSLPLRVPLRSSVPLA